MSNDKVEYSNEWCKYEFTTEEKRDIAETLAIKTKDLEKAEDEKKSVMSAFKEKIDKIALDVKSSARKYTDGYEMRDIECVVERDFASGEVRYIRTDNGVVARTSKMTMAERQMKVEDAAKRAVTAIPAETPTAEDISNLCEAERKIKDIQREMSSEKSAL